MKVPCEEMCCKQTHYRYYFIVYYFLFEDAKAKYGEEIEEMNSLCNNGKGVRLDSGRRSALWRSAPVDLLFQLSAQW
jgi:hypothetical protein